MQMKFAEGTFWHRLMFTAASGVLLLGMASISSAQSSGQSSTPSQPSGAPTAQASDNDINRTELRNFDEYLDSYPGVAAQLKQNPGLINDSNFLSQHPGLQEFLKNHPHAAEELRENPQQVMNREGRFERSGGDISRGELRNFDNFLDSHPEVREDLQKNPSLVNNKEYLENHPQLRDFLEDHPGVRQELREHPGVFMNRERGFERSGGDITRRELSNFDNFLDSHPDVAKQLAKNPSLVDNKEYLENHPQLRDFLEDHPGARQELREHPQMFMAREERFERTGGDISRGELRSFDNFLDSHPEVREDLQKNPSLVNNKDYLASHPGLKDYLEDHPRVRQEVKEHPKVFIARERRFEQHEGGEHGGRRHRDPDHDRDRDRNRR